MKSSGISKRDIRLSFSRASGTYDYNAQIQQEVNRMLMSKLPPVRFKDILEIGCGTGALTKSLVSCCRPERFLAVDLSPDMLSVARRRFPGLTDINFLCCDGERLGLKPGRRFDLLISASAMQWFTRLKSTIGYLVKNHLAEKGLFLSCFFGRNSLRELSEALCDAFPGRDTTIPAASFPDIGKDLQGFDTLFSNLSIEQKTIETVYKDLRRLLMAFKTTGVSPRGRRPLLLSSPGAVSRLEKCYLKKFGRIRVSFEIIVVSGTGK